MKEKKNVLLGRNAQKILLYSLPLMIFLAFALTLHIARLDSHIFLQQREIILLSLTTISRLSFCLALGTVLADYAEKRSAHSR